MEYLVHQQTETEIFEYILDLPLLSQIMEQIDYHWDIYKVKETKIFEDRFVDTIKYIYRAKSNYS